MRVGFMVCGFTVSVTCSVLGQQSQWRLAGGTDQLYISAIDIYRGSSRDTMYAMGFTDSADVNSLHLPRFLRSIDGGNTWDSISDMGAGLGALKVDPSSSLIIYASHPGWDPSSNDISVSRDGGVTWSTVFRGRRFPAPIVEIDPVDRQRVYVTIGPGMLWYTSDHGVTWQWMQDTVSGNPTSLAISPLNDSIMWTSGQFDVRKSTDRGASFIPVLSNPWLAWSQVAINPKNPDIVYVSFFDTSGGLFKTTDGGITWRDANGDLPTINRHVYRIALNPRNPDELDLGVGTPTFGANPLLFRSLDGGTHWTAFSDGLPDSLGHVESILIDTVANKLFVGVGAYGRSGLYVCDCLTSSGRDNPSVPLLFSLSQNYPNPFNPRTMIIFSLANRDYVTLEVTDALGRRIATLVNSLVEPGEHRISFEASVLPSGVFFYRLRTSHGVVSKKMVVLR